MRRIRVLIYECDSREQLDQQLASSVQGKRLCSSRMGCPLTVQAIDVDMLKVSLSEVWMLLKLDYWLTMKSLGWSEKDSRDKRGSVPR